MTAGDLRKLVAGMADADPVDLDVIYRDVEVDTAFIRVDDFQVVGKQVVLFASLVGEGE